MPDDISMKTLPVVQSEPGQIKWVDVKSLASTLGIVVASAVITKLLEILPGVTLTDGNLQLIMTVVIMVLKLAQKVVTDRTYVVNR